MNPHRTLRGAYLHPTVVTRYFRAEGYLPPGQPGLCLPECPEGCLDHWDPQKPPAGLKSQSTRATFDTACRLLQAQHPDKRVTEFTEEDLVLFLKQGRDPKTGKKWAPGTVKLRATALRVVFGWALWQQLVRVNPALHINRHLKERVQGIKAHIWLTAEESQALVERCDLATPTGLRDRVALLLGLTAGLRVHEISEITWDKVNLWARQLEVDGKGGKIALLPIRPNLQTALEKWRLMCEEANGPDVGRQPVVCHVRMSNFVPAEERSTGEWTVRWSKSIASGTLRLLVHRAGARIGRPLLAPHDLRRTYAGLLESRDVPLRQISHLLRHASIAVTERYLEGNPFKNSQEGEEDVF